MVDIKSHFDQMANEYDGLIRRIIPYYDQLIDSVVGSIPFKSKDEFQVLDIGCGTGNLSLAIKKHFPQAQITCIDLAADMLKIAKSRLSDFDDINFIEADISTFKSDQEFDVAVSTLVLHHIREDSEKMAIYKNIYSHLSREGSLWIGDIVLGATSHLQDLNTNKWIAHMQKTIANEEINSKWLPRHYETDRPCKLLDELKWISTAGFVQTDVVAKYFNIAVYGGVK